MLNGVLEYKLQSFDEARKEFINSEDNGQINRSKRYYKDLQCYRFSWSTKNPLVAEVIDPQYIYKKLELEPSDEYVKGTNITNRDLCFYIDRRQAMTVVYKSQLMSYDYGFLFKLLSIVGTEQFYVLCYILSWVFIEAVFIRSAIMHWEGWSSIFWISLGSLLTAVPGAISLAVLCLALILVWECIPLSFNLVAYLRYKIMLYKFDSDVKMKTCKLSLEDKTGKRIDYILEHEYTCGIV